MAKTAIGIPDDRRHIFCYLSVVQMKNLSKQVDHHPRAGFTLPEVVISVVLTAFMLAAAYQSSKLAGTGSKRNAIHVAAFGLCKDRYERMRGGDYTLIVSSNFPAATVNITHLGGFQKLELTGSISNIITTLATPARKQVQIFVTWKYYGLTETESLSGCIVDRNSTASVMGQVSGTLILNPNSTNPTLFSLILPSGTTYGLSDITNKNFCYSGPITHLTYKAGGSGIQTSLSYNFQPYPMANAKRWDLDSDDGLNCDLLWYDTVAKKWDISLSGYDTVISCQ